MKAETGSNGPLLATILPALIVVAILSACTGGIPLQGKPSAAAPDTVASAGAPPDPTASLTRAPAAASGAAPTKLPAGAAPGKTPLATATSPPSPTPEPSATLWRPRLPKEDCQPSSRRKCAVLLVLPEENYAANAQRLPMQFRSAGYRVAAASRSPDVVEICSNYWGSGDPKAIKVNLALVDVRVVDYDAVIFIGGFGCQEQWQDEEAHRIAREAVEAGLVLGAVGCAPTILAYAGVLKGRTVAICERSALVKRGLDYCHILEDKGAICSDADLVRDGLIVSAAPGSNFLVPAIIAMIDGH